MYFEFFYCLIPVYNNVLRIQILVVYLYFYYYNFNLGDGKTSDAQIERSANVLLFGDGVAGASSVSDYNRDRLSTTDKGPVRHLEGANYAFVDGHVKWFKPSGILPGNTGCSGGVNSPSGSNATFCVY